MQAYAIDLVFFLHIQCTIKSIEMSQKRTQRTLFSG